MKSRGRARVGRRTGEESGFVLLLVLLMASAILVTLYRVMPREAFERQRDREQLLIDRGEQYKRAIKMYVRKFKQYPVELKALEESNGMHFLRHKYKDPMTWKDEWRLIHAGPGGTFPDSKTMQPAKSDKDKDKPKENTFITAGPTMSQPTSQVGAVTPTYLIERGGQSSTPVTQPGGGSSYPGGTTDPNYQPQPGMPGMVSGGQIVQSPTTVPGQSPYPQQFPGQPGMTGVPPGVPYPGQPYPVPPGIPGVPPNYPSGAANSQQGGAVFPYSTQPGQGGAPTTFGAGVQQPPGTTPNAAMQMIQSLLTTPRPGGLTGTTSNSQTGGLTGGIAGIASKSEMKSIKKYKDKEEYDEWEFIYNPADDILPGRQTGMMGVNPTGNPNLASGGGNNAPTQTNTSPFGNTPSNTSTSPFGSNSPFGSTPTPTTMPQH